MARIYCGWDSAYTVVISCNAIRTTDAQLFEEGCSLSSFTYTFTPLEGDPNFTCDVARTHNTQNWEPLGGMRFSVSGNTTNTTRVGRIDVTYYDTEGNSYNQSTTITQPSCSPTPSARNIYCDWASAWTPDTPCNGYSDYDAQLHVENCTLDGFSYMFQIISGDSSFTCDVARTHNTQNWEPLGGIRARVSGNTTNETRVGYLYVTFRDTDQNLYNQRMIITQPPSCSPTPTDSYIRFANSATTVPTRNGSWTTPLEYSGCTVDSGNCEIVSVVGNLPITGVGIQYSSYEQRYNLWFRFDGPNVTPDDRSSELTVRFYDTDGNSYLSTITINQPADEYIIYHAFGAPQYSSNPIVNLPSSKLLFYDEVIPINTQVCSIQLGTTGSSHNPQLWEGVEKPAISIIGNYIRVDWPANPFEESRSLTYNFTVVWGDDCENSEGRSFTHLQEAKYNPGNKDIEADTTEYNAASGGGDGSTVIQASGCTYDHFTYITGGSFSVTATSGPNNTIIFTYPENPTTSARTGYVYVTYYDEDGNPYGPQTITFNQQAGSSPGPGPGPEPESGYVLTSLTISDQEQHRYFVEAKPGIVYSAAGQYYKTVLACEARYSLYYVNSYGGVDVLPFKEKGWKKSDTVTRFNYSRSFRNNTLEFENVNYMNEIKASWELHSGWMSDESSQRMHELVESTIVYLYDAEEKTYTPVVMTDKKLEYKTYHNQGRKFYNYTVNVEESQSKERR